MDWSIVEYFRHYHNLSTGSAYWEEQVGRSICAASRWLSITHAHVLHKLGTVYSIGGSGDIASVDRHHLDEPEDKANKLEMDQSYLDYFGRFIPQPLSSHSIHSPLLHLDGRVK